MRVRLAHIGFMTVCIKGLRTSVFHFYPLYEKKLVYSGGMALTVFLRDGMRAVQDGVPRLHVQQVQLYGIPCVHVAIREEKLAS